jgi:hypothetical protein
MKKITIAQRSANVTGWSRAAPGLRVAGAGAVSVGAFVPAGSDQLPDRWVASSTFLAMFSGAFSFSCVICENAPAFLPCWLPRNALTTYQHQLH